MNIYKVTCVGLETRDTLITHNHIITSTSSETAKFAICSALGVKVEDIKEVEFICAA